MYARVKGAVIGLSIGVCAGLSVIVLFHTARGGDHIIPKEPGKAWGHIQRDGAMAVVYQQPYHVEADGSVLFRNHVSCECVKTQALEEYSTPTVTKEMKRGDYPPGDGRVPYVYLDTPIRIQEESACTLHMEYAWKYPFAISAKWHTLATLPLKVERK